MLKIARSLFCWTGDVAYAVSHVLSVSIFSFSRFTMCDPGHVANGGPAKLGLQHCASRTPPAY